MSVPFIKHIQLLPDTVPFVGPETLERLNGKAFSARLGANESAFGISSGASQALSQANYREACSWYGDPENFELRTLLNEKHGIAIQNICVDAGIDSLLGLTIRMFVEPGITVVTSQGAYPTVNYHVAAYGGTIHTVPYKNNHEDPVALLEAAHATNARLVYLANPDNPMGTCLQADDINALINGLPEGCLLMLDEAYVEFMDQMPPLPLDIGNNNVIRYRTFSKAYGMAGMRIGYVIAHVDIIAGFNRIRNHFGVNRLAQLAATASLRDTEFLPYVTRLVNEGRQRIYQMASSLSLDYLPSATNFVAVDIGSTDKARQVISSLAQAGVFMRQPGVSPLNRYIRVGVGTEKEHEYLESIMTSVIERHSND